MFSIILLICKDSSFDKVNFMNSVLITRIMTYHEMHVFGVWLKSANFLGQSVVELKLTANYAMN